VFIRVRVDLQLHCCLQKVCQPAFFRVRDNFQSYGSLKYYMHLNKTLYIRNGLDKPEVLITRMIVCIDESFVSFGKISVGMAQPHLGTNRNHRKVRGVFSEMQVDKFEPAFRH